MGTRIKPTLTLMLGGTSLTTGRLCTPPLPWTRYLLEDMMAAPECQGPVRIINTGQGSQTSNFGASQAALMAPLRPTHVLMEDFGINDCAIGPVSIPQATLNFNSMVQSYRNANPDVIIAHQTMSPASAGDTLRTNLAAYYDNGLANAALNDLESLDNYYGTVLVPGGWPKPLPVNLTVSSWSVTPTAGYTGFQVQTTWDPAAKGPSITLSNGDLTALANSASNGTVRATNPISGNLHFELTIDLEDSGRPIIGVANASASLTSALGISAGGAGILSDGTVYVNSVMIGNAGMTYTTGDVVAVEVDTVGNLIYFMRTGFRSVGFNISAITGTRYPAASCVGLGTGGTALFNGDGLHTIWAGAFELYSYPNIKAWARRMMADFW